MRRQWWDKRDKWICHSFSGWSWLCENMKSRVFIFSPLCKKIIKEKIICVLGLQNFILWHKTLLVVYFSLFHLLQNQRANFIETWHKSSMGDGNSSLLKKGLPRWHEIVKIHWRNLKISSQEPLGQFQPNLALSILGEGDLGLFKWRTIQNSNSW